MLGVEFQRLGAPTAMLLVGPHICIGTQSGTVLAMPQASAQRGSTDFAVDLKPTAGIGRLLTSFFARCCPCIPLLSQDHNLILPERVMLAV